MNDVFYSKGLHFSCTRCSRCCRSDPGFVYLSENDLTNLCKWFNFNESEFICSFCRFVYSADGQKVLSLREKPNYDCILWNQGCTAYGARPVQCSTYPFWSFIMQSKETWDKEASVCPGINVGKLCTLSEIKQALSAYCANIPLRYEQIRRILKGSEL